MILYLDSSSLVKLYVEEMHSDDVREWVAGAEIVATCRVAFPEVLSAITRRFRRGELSRDDFDTVASTLEAEWRTYVALDFDELEAGRLVRAYGLRGFDSVHLSAARRLVSGSDPVNLAFSSFDAELNNAAAAEGLVVLAPATLPGSLEAVTDK